MTGDSESSSSDESGSGWSGAREKGEAGRLLKRRFQRRFFERAPELEIAIRVFGLVPDSQIFVKDADSRFVYGSPAFARGLGAPESLELVFTFDHDYFPPVVADDFVRDDRKILDSGRPMNDRLEIRYRASSGFAWFVTTKYPVLDVGGAVIGVVGVTRNHCEGETSEQILSPPTGDTRLSKAVDFIGSRPRRTPTSGEIARAADVSVRQLNRLFQEAFQMTPRKFSSVVRLYQASRRLTETDDPIVDIALEFGFSDHSSFTSNFRKFTGLTPWRFRKRWKNGGDG